MVVFDFDKTLTNQDTLWGFYKEVDGDHPLFLVKRALLLFFAILYKANIIGNTLLKKIGVGLFLKGKSRGHLLEKAGTYTQTISLNDIYTSYFLSVPKEKRIIVSASFDIYLNSLFPEEKVIGSSLRFRKEIVSGLDINIYGEQKRSALKENGIEKIDSLFTDSYSDLPLMEMAAETKMVEKGKVIA